MDPIGILQNVVGVIMKVKEVYDGVTSNNEFCKKLVIRMDALEPITRKLVECRDNLPVSTKTISLLQESSNNTLSYMEKYGKQNFLQKAIGNATKDFEELDRDLLFILTQLNTGLQVDTSLKNLANYGANAASETASGSYRVPYQINPLETFASSPFSKELGSHKGMTLCVRFNQDVIAVGGQESCIKLYDRRSMRETSRLNHHKGMMRIMHFGPGSSMYSGGADKTLASWDLNRTSPLVVFKGHTDEVNQVQTSGGLLYSCGDDSTIRTWDPRSGKQTGSASYQGMLYDLDISNGVMAVVSKKGEVGLFDERTMSQFSSIKLQSNAGYNVKLDDNELIVATNNAVEFYNSRSWQLKYKIHCTQYKSQFGSNWVSQNCYAMQVAPRVICAGYGNALCVWNRATNQLINHMIDHTDGIYSVCFDDELLCTCSFDGKVYAYMFR